MIDRIKNKIDMHIAFFEEAENITKNLVSMSSNLDITRFVNTLDNRARLVNIVSTIQEDAERMLEHLNKHDLTREFIEHLQKWQSKSDGITKHILDMDCELLDRLENEKSDAAKEIAIIFKKRNALKGYNLNNVER